MEINSDTVLSMVLGRGMSNPVAIRDIMAALELTPGNKKGAEQLRRSINDVLSPDGPVREENGYLWMRS